MPELDRRPIAGDGLALTTMGLGGTGLGNMYRAVDPADAIATVHAAYARGLRYFDTAPVYGFGLSETRLGEAIRSLPRDEIVISTKVGYDLVPITRDALKPTLWDAPPPFRADFDYSRDGTLRSLEASLKRLGLDRVDMVSIHDPDEAIDVGPGQNPRARSHFREAMDGAYPVLAELRAQGVIRAIGVGINQWQMLADFVRAGRFDYFLLAGRYTLLEQEPLEALFPACEARGTRLVIGGPYNSGILATGAAEGATFNTKKAPPAVLERVRRIEATCARHGVPLPAAALQFPLGHPLVATVIPGARSVAELDANLAFLRHPIPSALWLDLAREGLIDPKAPVPPGADG